jgi:ankyrin repeat protein
MTYPLSPVIPYLFVNKCNIPSMMTEQQDIALQNAALQGNLFFFIFLVESFYYNFEYKLPNALRLLELSAKHGHLDIVKYLLSVHHDNILSLFPNGSTILHTAAEYGHLDIIKYLRYDCQANLNIRLEDGWTVIHIAARNGFYNIIEFLVGDKTVDMNIELPDGRKALDIAIHYVHLGIMTMLAPFAANKISEEVYNDNYYSDEIVGYSGVSNPLEID